MALSHPYAKAKLFQEETSLQGSKVFYGFALPALIVLNGLLSPEKLIWMTAHTHLGLQMISERNLSENNFVSLPYNLLKREHSVTL